MANHAQLIRQENSGLSVARRERRFIEFDLGNGKKRHVATIDPLHIRNTETEIDTAWEDGDQQPYFKQMVKSDYHVYAGLNSNVTFNAGQIIEYRQPDTGAWVKLQPQDLVWENEWGSTQYISAPQEVAAQVNDDTLYWSGAYGAGRNFLWRAETRHLRKELILDSLAQLGSPPAWMTPELVQLRLQFLFDKSSTTEIWYDTGDGYQLWDESTPVQTNVRIEFRQDNELLWYFEPAHAYDSSDSDQLPLTTRLLKSGNVLFVEVTVPWTWLQNAVYPVVVDPTFTDGYEGDATTYFDGRVNEVSPNNAYATADSLTCIGNPVARAFALFKFAVSSLSGATVTGADLYLYNSSEITSSIDHVLNSILSGNDGWVEACTWNYADGSGASNRWAGDSGADGSTDAGCSVSGTDWNATSLGAVTYSANTDVGTEHVIELSTSQVQGWIDSVHYGIILRSTNVFVTGNGWASSDHATTGYRPKLVVEYTEAVSASASASASPSSTLSPSASASASKPPYDIIMSYRTGASVALCQAEEWTEYTVPFASAGYVQVRVERPE